MRWPRGRGRIGAVLGRCGCGVGGAAWYDSAVGCGGVGVRPCKALRLCVGLQLQSVEVQLCKQLRAVWLSQVWLQHACRGQAGAACHAHLRM